MKRLLFFMLLTSFLVSSCSNQNSNIEGNLDKSTAKVESQTDKKTRERIIDPAIPEPLPPAKGGIIIEPLPPAKQEDRYTVIYETEKYVIDKVLSQTIDYHNDNKSPNETPPFPKTIKAGETISREVTKSGNTIQVDATATVERKNESYVVTLTIDYNTILNEEKAISFWKYEVSKDEIEMIDKNDDVNWDNIFN
ncbi:MAG TPA: hypothetical protein VK135_06880 [Candidatus Dormibacteraeota bacterium]|nr:hypothetical protein [Candidatus Dormibacteraeota bacterium]